MTRLPKNVSGCNANLYELVSGFVKEAGWSHKSDQFRDKPKPFDIRSSLRHKLIRRQEKALDSESVVPGIEYLFEYVYEDKKNRSDKGYWYDYHRMHFTPVDGNINLVYCAIVVPVDHGLSVQDVGNVARRILEGTPLDLGVRDYPLQQKGSRKNHKMVEFRIEGEVAENTLKQYAPVINRVDNVIAWAFGMK